MLTPIYDTPTPEEAAAAAESFEAFLTRQHAAEEADFDLDGFLAKVAWKYNLGRVKAALLREAA